MRYDELILGNLLDSYENSLLSSGKNKVQIHISMSFSKRTCRNILMRVPLFMKKFTEL